MALATETLDAMLAIEDGYDSARWNFLSAGGTPISDPGGLREAVALTYAFPSDVPDYAEDDQLMAGAFSGAQSAAAVAAMAAIAEVTRVTFQPAANGAAGDIAFRTSPQEEGTAAYAYFPAFSYRTTQDDIIVADSIVPEALSGDVWLNASAYAPGDSFAKGSDGYETLLHELGHALGLKHPFETDSLAGVALPLSLDDTRHTVMSYTTGTRMGLLEVTGDQFSYSWTSYDLAPRSLMPLDIAALQSLYGANTSTRAGNDTYRWSTGEVFVETIWDGGGTDTIDCTNQSLKCIVDLTAGNFSSIGLRQTATQIRDGLGVPSFVDIGDLPPDLYDGSRNLAIAYDVVIENAIGGAGNDQLLGNGVANVLEGGPGNDVLNGKTGSDTASYRSAASGVTVSLALTGAQDTLGAGRDTLQNMEHLTGSAFGDGLTGNGSANRLGGGKGADTLAGGGGNDTLIGGAGKDKLTGGSGLDVFRFETTPNATSNRDTVADFNPADDTLQLENAIFTAFVGTGALAADSLRKGAGIESAADANDFLLYNTTNGALFYDADGSGSAGAVQIAVLTGIPSLTNADFMIT